MSHWRISLLSSSLARASCVACVKFVSGLGPPLSAAQLRLRGLIALCMNLSEGIVCSCVTFRSVLFIWSRDWRATSSTPLMSTTGTRTRSRPCVLAAVTCRCHIRTISRIVMTVGDVRYESGQILCGFFAACGALLLVVSLATVLFSAARQAGGGSSQSERISWDLQACPVIGGHPAT